MKRLLYLVAIALIAFAACAKDDSNKVLARVGSKKITVGDFREAYKAIPSSYLPKEGGLAARKQVLDDLVNKDLLVLESYKQGLDKDKGVLENTKKMEEQVLLTDLYTREVADKAKVVEKELKERYEKMAQEEEVHARHIIVSTPEKAQEVLKRAKAGEDFAELAKKYSEDTSTAPKGGDLGFLGRDLMLPPEFHDALFKLQSGQISEVVKTNFGYHIIKVDEKRKRKLDPFEKMKGTLEANLLREKRMELAKNYLDKIKKDYQIKINDVNVKALADEMRTAATPNGIALLEFSKRFAPDQKARPLATSTVANYTIGDLLTSLGAAGMGQIQPQVDVEQLKSMVESEAIIKPLLADARKAGIEKQKDVQKDLERLREGKMVELLYQKEVRDKVTISDDEIVSYYGAHAQNYGHPGTIHFKKLLVYDKRLADSLATLARRGADFANLVEKNSADRVSAASGGEVEMRVGADPGLDSLTQRMKTGQIAGPIATGEGFIVIKLVERTAGTTTPLEAARVSVNNDIQREKEEQGLQVFLKKMREKYKPTINEKLLAELKLETAPTAPKPAAPQ
jgi:peptidyl-prolyl cis-trans isomerase C